MKPRSFITKAAKTNMSTSIPARSRNGTPRFVAWAMTPPSTEPANIAMPVTMSPRPKTASRLPVYPVEVSASTSHASTAPEKKVKPSPSSTDTIAHQTKGACQSQSSQYSAGA